MKIIIIILCALMITGIACADHMHVYIMDTTCNDFIDLNITGTNVSIYKVSEVDGNRTSGLVNGSKLVANCQGIIQGDR